MMVTRARRDAVQDRYEQLLMAAETLADSIDEVAYNNPPALYRQSALAAVEAASDVCSRLGQIIRALSEMPVDP